MIIKRVFHTFRLINYHGIEVQAFPWIPFSGQIPGDGSIHDGQSVMEKLWISQFLKNAAAGKKRCCIITMDGPIIEIRVDYMPFSRHHLNNFGDKYFCHPFHPFRIGGTCLGSLPSLTSSQFCISSS